MIPSIPKAVSSFFAELEDGEFESLLRYAHQLLVNSGSASSTQSLDKLDANATVEVIGFILAVIQGLIGRCEAPKQIEGDLMACGLSNGQSKLFSTFLLNERNKLYSRKSLDILWRIDISLASSTAEKAPVKVLLCIRANGKRYLVEMDAKMFHNLRFNVCYLLKTATSVSKSIADKKINAT